MRLIALMAMALGLLLVPLVWIRAGGTALLAVAGVLVLTRVLVAPWLERLAATWNGPDA